MSPDVTGLLIEAGKWMSFIFCMAIVGLVFKDEVTHQLRSASKPYGEKIRSSFRRAPKFLQRVLMVIIGMIIFGLLETLQH